MKVCKACGHSKPLEDFHRQEGGREGRAARCKSCRRGSPGQRKEYQRQYYLKNRERILARDRARQADPGYRAQKSDYTRRWRASDPEKARLTARRTRIKREYGLTLEEYDAILSQGCAICGSHEGRVVGKRNGWTPPPARLCLDHNHADGTIREALCHSCNSGLGLFLDDPARLRAAADYLERHADRPVYHRSGSD